jgi:hypothetical protein
MKVKHGTTNFKALIPFIEKVDSNDGYGKFHAKGYMDLTIENIGYEDHEGHPVYSICHYGEMNGDLMRDPEITFSVDFENKSVLPLSFQNDYMGYYRENFVWKNGKVTGFYPHRLHECDDFLWMWGKNLKDQGFLAESMTGLS